MNQWKYTFEDKKQGDACQPGNHHGVPNTVNILKEKIFDNYRIPYGFKIEKCGSPCKLSLKTFEIGMVSL